MADLGGAVRQRRLWPIKRHRAFAHERQLLCVGLPLRAAPLSLPKFVWSESGMQASI